MPTPRRLLRQHLTVAAVAASGGQVRVRLQDRWGARHEVRFLFDDARSAADHRGTLDRWRRAGTPLTYVRSAGQGVLLDDAAWFAHALGPSPA